MPWQDELPALLALSDQEAADAINAMTETVAVPITSAQMLRWLGGNARYRRLEVAAENAALGDAVRSVCEVALKMLDRESSTFDPSKAEDAAMVGVLVAAGVCTAEEANELAALGQVTRRKYDFNVGPHHVRTIRDGGQV